MMRWLIGSSMKASRGVVAAAVVLLAVGVWQVGKAKIDTLPEFAAPTVEVQTEALGLSPEEVEDLITVPLEQDLLDGTPWLDTIRSKSAPGLSSVEMVFEKGTDLYRARQVVQERISQAAGLPQVSKPPQMVQPESSSGRTMMISLTSKNLTPVEMGVLSRWTIRPALLAVPDVANVAIWGQRERQIQVQVDPQKMRDKKVTLEQVVSSTGNALWVSPLTFLEASSPGTGGFIDTPNQRIGVQHNLPILKAEDLGNVVIDDAPISGMTLSDVATVVEDHQPLIGDASVTGNARGTGFLLVVDKLPGANTSDVTAGVEQTLEKLRPALKGLEMNSTIFRPATYVDNSNDNLARFGIIGGVLLAFGLLALFVSWRKALISLVAFSASMIAALLVLRGFDITFNAFIIVGLVVAVPAVIYDSVSTVDAIARRKREAAVTAQEAEERPTDHREVVMAAAAETGRAMLWATVIFAVALMPIYLMDGLSGDAFYPPAAAASLVAVAASLLVALTFTPALSLLLQSKAPPRESMIGRRLGEAYSRALAPLVRTPVAAYAAVAVVLVAMIVVVPKFDKSVLPGLRDNNVVVHWEAASGTSLQEMDRLTTRASAQLRDVTGVGDAGTNVGQAILGDQAVSPNSAETWVKLQPSADYDATLAAIRTVVQSYPGVSHRVATYSKDTMDKVLSQTSDEVTVRIFGEDLGVLTKKAGEVKDILAGTDGVIDENATALAGEPTIQVEVDPDKARLVGLKPGDVRRQSATLISGLRVGNLFEDQKVFDVQVWSTPESRDSVGSVQNLLIDTPTLGPVRVGDIAAVTVKRTVPVIEHEDVSRFVDVRADVSGRDVGAVERDVREKLSRLEFPANYHAELTGDYAAQKDSENRMLWLAIVVALGILLFLQAAFTSWRLAFMSLATLPVAMSGGVISAWIDSSVMTLATIVGLLAVLAIALRQSVMLLHRIQATSTDAERFDLDLLVGVSRECMGPTLTSAAVTALVMIPAVSFGIIPGMEILRPTAVVILGGLVTTAVVTLFILPALYMRFGPRQLPKSLEVAVDMAEAERVLEIELSSLEKELASPTGDARPGESE